MILYNILMCCYNLVLFTKDFVSLHNGIKQAIHVLEMCMFQFSTHTTLVNKLHRSIDVCLFSITCLFLAMNYYMTRKNRAYCVLSHERERALSASLFNNT